MQKHARPLVEMGNRFAGGLPTISYGPHTLLKVIAVRYYADMFAKIAKGGSARRRGYNGAVYLDLFSGPGVIQVGGGTDFVVGSPIAATYIPHPFDYSIFVEINDARAAALGKRASRYLAPGQFDVINGDSNALIGDVVKMVLAKCSRPIVLAFIDPQGMEASWSIAKTLSSSFDSIDFMLNVTSGVARVAGRIQGGMVGDRQIFEDFFGDKADEILMRMNQGLPVAKQYEDAVKQVLGRSQGETIDICDAGDRVVYHLLGYTRESMTGSPWALGFKDLKRRLEAFDGQNVSHVLDVLQGRQKSLVNHYRSN